VGGDFLGEAWGLNPLPFPQSSIMENILPRYCLNCKKLGKLILRKIIKIVATRWGILKLNCTKFDSGWDSDPDPTGGSGPQ